MPRYTPDEIIEFAKIIAQQVNTPLTRREFVRLSRISESQIDRAFPDGRWSEVKRLAGLERHPMDKISRSDNELLIEFHRVASELGRLPTWAIFEARANVSEQTISNRFGGRRGTIRRYRIWLKDNDPNSPLVEHVEAELGHKTSKRLPKSRTTFASKKSAQPKRARIQEGSTFIDLNRLNELRSIKCDLFDLSKLIRLCEELNESYRQELYFAVAMLVRAILDHVPPIFDAKNFTQAANNYGKGSSSFKASMEHLENSSRRIADAHLHSQIRKRESLPNRTQVNFANDLDVLFAEIVRLLK